MGNPCEAELPVPLEAQRVWRAWSVPLGVFLLPVLQGRASQGWSRISWLLSMEFPVPLVPSVPGPAGLSAQVMKAPSKSCSVLPSCLVLGVSHNHRVPLGLLRVWVDTDLCHSMGVHTHTLGSREKPGKGALGAQGAGFLSPGSRPKAARAGSWGVVLECSVQWLCLPGHCCGDLVIPLCQLLHTGMGGKGAPGHS